VLGAAEAITLDGDRESVDRQIAAEQSRGRRLLLFAAAPNVPAETTLDESIARMRLSARAILSLGDELRPDAGDVIVALAHQGIAFKVISGDNPETVLATVQSIEVLARDAAVVTGDQAMAGDDIIRGGEGTNYLRGDEGNDSIVGGAQFDDINGNLGDDTAMGGVGDDWVVGGKDNDMLMGEIGNDIVYGNIGNDTCDAGDGADIVRGGQGDDIVRGGGGDDFVSGDRGDDTMTGGAGADTFHTFGEAGIDRVTDFNVGQDKVHVDPGTQFAVAQVGADTVISMIGGGQMILVGVQMSGLPAGWIFGA